MKNSVELLDVDAKQHCLMSCFLATREFKTVVLDDEHAEYFLPIKNNFEHDLSVLKNEYLLAEAMEGKSENGSPSNSEALKMMELLFDNPFYLLASLLTRHPSASKSLNKEQIERFLKAGAQISVRCRDDVGLEQAAHQRLHAFFVVYSKEPEKFTEDDTSELLANTMIRSGKVLMLDDKINLEMAELKDRGLNDEIIGLMGEVFETVIMGLMEDTDIMKHIPQSDDVLANLLSTAVPESAPVQEQFSQATRLLMYGKATETEVPDDREYDPENLRDGILTYAPKFLNKLTVDAINYFSVTESGAEDPHDEKYLESVAKKLPTATELRELSIIYGQTMVDFDKPVEKFVNQKMKEEFSDSPPLDAEAQKKRVSRKEEIKGDKVKSLSVALEKKAAVWMVNYIQGKMQTSSAFRTHCQSVSIGIQNEF
jgi:hypothetical protein